MGSRIPSCSYYNPDLSCLLCIPDFYVDETKRGIPEEVCKLVTTIISDCVFNTKDTC